MLFLDLDPNYMSMANLSKYVGPYSYDIVTLLCIYYSCSKSFFFFYKKYYHFIELVITLCGRDLLRGSAGAHGEAARWVPKIGTLLPHLCSFLKAPSKAPPFTMLLRTSSPLPLLLWPQTPSVTSFSDTFQILSDPSSECPTLYPLAPGISPFHPRAFFSLPNSCKSSE